MCTLLELSERCRRRPIVGNLLVTELQLFVSLSVCGVCLFTPCVCVCIMCVCAGLCVAGTVVAVVCEKAREEDEGEREQRDRFVVYACV